MDTAWMKEKVEEFLLCIDSYNQAYRLSGFEWNGECARYNDQATMLLPTLRRILSALDALPSEQLLPPSYSDSSDTERAAKEALGILRDRDEWAVRLAPQAPTFAADRFHPWIWQVAGPFWDAGQMQAAVESGAKVLTARIQQKSGLDIADRELAAEVFSSKASSSRVRLWLPGDRTTDTWRSRQDGLHYLAMGMYAGIRNVAAHSHAAGWSEQEALEYLAVLSTVARWVDEAQLVQPSSPTK